MARTGRNGLFIAGVVALAAVLMTSVDARSGGNPVRKIVTMLQNIKKKVEDEGKLEEKLFEKAMCECKKNVAGISKSIEEAKSKGSDNAAAIKGGEGQKSQLESDLKQHKADRFAAKEAMASATGIRDKEAKAFKAAKAEADVNIAGITKAVGAIEAGSSGSFLQTGQAKQLTTLIQAKDTMYADDRTELLSFLSGTESSDGSGEIIGILKQLGEDMGKDLAEMVETETDAIGTYETLLAAKKKEIEALTIAIEVKMARVGELGQRLAEMKGLGGDAAESAEDDAKFLADIKKECAAKEHEWDEVSKARQQEVVALSDTIKLLNDDDALDLFKKTLPSAASFLQVADTENEAVRHRVLSFIQQTQKKHKKHKKKGMHKLDFITLALHGKRKGFDKVVSMIGKMINILNTEQGEDDKKKAYCESEFDLADDQKKSIERTVSDAQTAIEDAKESVATNVEEVKALKKTIEELDAQVAEATTQRQQENAAFKQLVTENNAARDLLGMAKKRLNKFYNPELAASFDQEDFGNANKYQQKRQQAGGVIALLTNLLHDIDLETTVADTEEKNAQEEYQTAMADAKTKRTADAKLLEDKEAAKANTDAALQGHVDSKAAASKELAGNADYITSLHADCDWLMKNYDSRKQARADETDALGKASDVLKGADFSFLQVSQSRHLAGTRRILLHKHH